MKHIRFLTILLKCMSVFILSTVIFYYITSYWISYIYQGSFTFEKYVYITIWIGQTIFLYLLLQMITHKNIPSTLVKLLWILYFLLMAILLFGRNAMEYIINLNILDIIPNSLYASLQNAYNLLLFVPLGLCIRKRNTYIVIIGTLIFVTLIETIQLVTMRGIFDIVDIVLNTFGIMLGYFIEKYIPNKYLLRI